MNPQCINNASTISKIKKIKSPIRSLLTGFSSLFLAWWLYCTTTVEEVTPGDRRSATELHTYSYIYTSTDPVWDRLSPENEGHVQNKTLV